tara:strand:- start:4084 stop:6324 length:2241 start_codon:yes stop_codon:yes gene_type:complete
MTVSSSTTKNSRSANGTQHSFAYDFKIFAASDLEVIVRTTAGTETIQTLDTNYIVTGAGNANGGNVLFKFTTTDASNAHHDASTDHRPANTTTVIMRRKLTLTQGTDYVENDPFPAAAHEDALDRLTMVTQQIQEEVDRSIKASTGNTFSGATFTLSATDRANKIFAFDSSGNLAVTQELGTFRGNFAASTAYAVRDLVKDTSTNNIFIVNEAHTSSGSQPLTTNANSAKYTLIVDAASATTSATNAAASAATATTKASEAATSATQAANSLTTFQNQYHGASSSDPTSNLDAGDLYFNTSSGIKVYNGSAFEDVKPTSTEQTNINTVAGISSDVTTVAGLNTTHLANVSGQASNIGSLGPISSDITTLANISSDVTSLANSLEKTYTVTVANVGGVNVFLLDGVNYPAIEMFRGNTYIFNLNDSTVDGHPLVFKNGSAEYDVGVTYFLNGASATKSNFVNVTTFNAGRSSGDRKVQIEVASSAPSSGLRYYCYIHGNAMGNTITVKDSNVSLVAGSIANVNLTGASIANVNTTAASIANVNSVATNIDTVNSFAARYRVETALPSSNNDAGDLVFNTSNNTLNFFDGSSFNPFVAGAMTSLVVDSSPQLGGNLDVNGNSIISASNGNIAITPNGSGKVILDGLSHPTADGSAGQFLKTDGSGTLSFATVNTDLSNDSSPQLGGDLDANSNDILMGSQSVKFGTSAWEIVLDGTDLDFKYNGTTVFKLASNGAVTSADNVTAFGSP